MKKKMIATLILAALIVIPMHPSVVTAAIKVTKSHSASKYVTRKVDGTAYTVSGTVNYDKNGGLLSKDFAVWYGNVSHDRKECGTDYVMYYEKVEHARFHLPYVKDHQKSFYDQKNVAKKYTYAKLRMDTLAGEYELRANE
ncbi:MAG: hypothetical protein Q4D32_03280 [Eubacteriales bacterium]|nr:hypothetical protein [Eubacteriales bacterium]